MSKDFHAWKAQADMPRIDSKGQWYDAETGLYFDPACTPAIFDFPRLVRAGLLFR